MSQVAFDPWTLAFKWAKTVHALDCAATVIDLVDIKSTIFRDITPLKQWKVRRRFGVTYHVNLQGGRFR
jgi:hypothetical protein